MYKIGYIGNFKTVPQVVEHIINNDINNSIQKTTEKFKLDLTHVEAISPTTEEVDFDLITDKNCQQAAKSLQQLIEQISRNIEKSKVKQSTQSGKSNNSQKQQIVKLLKPKKQLIRLCSSQNNFVPDKTSVFSIAMEVALTFDTMISTPVLYVGIFTSLT